MLAEMTMPDAIVGAATAISGAVVACFFIYFVLRTN